MPSSTPSSLQESLKFEGDPARGSLDPRSSGSRPSSVGTLSMADDPRNLNAFRFGTSRIPADPVLQFRLHVCPGADPARRCRYRSRSDKFHSRWNARRPLVPTAVRARARADLSGSAPLNEGKRPRWRRKQFPRPGEAYHKGPSPSHRGPRLDSTIEELYMTP